jgi:hypothetical protein
VVHPIEIDVGKKLGGQIADRDADNVACLLQITGHRAVRFQDPFDQSQRGRTSDLSLDERDQNSLIDAWKILPDITFQDI